MPVFSQPAPVNPVPRHGGFQKVPKSRRMVFFFNMHQLMNNHIVDNYRRRHDQPKAESQLILRRTGTPTRPGGSYSDACGLQLQPAADTFHLRRQVFCGPVFIPLNKIIFSHRRAVLAVKVKTAIAKNKAGREILPKKYFQRIRRAQKIKTFPGFIPFFTTLMFLFFRSAQIFLNPCGFLFQKTIDLSDRRKIRRLDNNISLLRNLQRNRLSSFSASLQNNETAMIDPLFFTVYR